MNKERDILYPRRENGKCITVDRGMVDSVPIIVWRKSQAPLLVLNLTLSEAERLRAMLNAAIDGK